MLDRINGIDVDRKLFIQKLKCRPSIEQRTGLARNTIGNGHNLGDEPTGTEL